MSTKLDMFTFYDLKNNLLLLMCTIEKVGFPAFFSRHYSVSVCVPEAAPPRATVTLLPAYMHVERGVINPTPPSQTV